MSKIKTVTFNKTVTFENIVIAVKIHAWADRMNSASEVIGVVLSDSSEDLLYIYEVNKLIDNNNKYIDAITEAVSEWISRQYRNEAVNVLESWDGVIN